MLAQRLLALRILLCLVLVVFGGRLVYLQVLQGSRWHIASQQNRLRWVRTLAPRGVIVDRTRRPLATSTEAVSAWVVSGEVPRDAWDGLLHRLVAIGLYADVPAARRALALPRLYPSFLPTRLQTNLSLPMLTRLEEELTRLPGVYLEPEPVRTYPDGPAAAHLLGYLREINATELATRRAQEYHLGDHIGKAGLERALESVLRGQEGGRQLEVDAYGRVLRTLQSVPPHPGQEVTLTIDWRVQQAAYTAMRGHRGAVVVLAPRTGDLLALMSAPAYDPNGMAGRLSPASHAWLRRTRAEYNRATLGCYPPGSVFKIVTAAAALEAGKVPAHATFYCPGIYKDIHCWKRTGHGSLSLTGAVAHSCNVAFMQLAERVGARSLLAMARRFGLGEATRLPGLRESSGSLPDPALRHASRQRWQLGETLQVGIGQSALIITPLQSARIIAAIANGGQLVTPRLVARLGDTLQPNTPPVSLNLRPATLQRIRRGLEAVVGEGTAQRLDPTLHIAGKTGTAQNPRGADHAWFVGYAPTEAPTVAVAVLVEHGGHGGETAAPIAEQVIRAALHPDTPATPATLESSPR
jgi:penicillin-binding protein 2